MLSERRLHRLSRRELLGLGIGLGFVATGLLEACSSAAPASPTSAPAGAAATSAPAPAASPAPAKPAASPVASPAASPAAVASPAATTAPAATVAPAATTAAAAAATPQAAAGPARRGGALKASLSGEPTTLSPLIARTTFDTTAFRPVLDMFFEYDDKFNPVPLIAQSVDVLPDLKTYVFKIRQDVTWHDGKHLTGQDIVDTIQTAQSQDVASLYILKRVIKDAAVSLTDDYTVRLELPAANGALLDIMTQLPILRKDFDEKTMIGTGPFKFVEWVRNQHLKYVRNDKYFKPDLPYLDELQLLPTADQTQAVNLVIGGQVDTIDQVAVQRVKDIEASGTTQAIFFPSDVAVPFYLFMMNNAHPPLDKVEVRQAIAWAIDREALQRAVFGYGAIRSNNVPPGHWVYDPSAPSYVKRDVAKAKDLMAQAGAADGFNLELTYHLLADEFSQFAQIVQGNLAEIGITVTLKQLEVGLWVDQVLRSKTFQSAMTWNVPGWDPDSLLGSWTRSDGASQSWARTDEFEALLQQGVAVVDIQQRKPIYSKVQNLVFTEVPGTVINEKATAVAASKKVNGFGPQLQGYTVYHKVWLSA